MRESSIPGFLCPDKLPDLLNLMGVPKEESTQSAANIVMYIIQQMSICFDTYLYKLRTTFARIRHVNQLKEEIERTCQVKTCDLCSQRFHSVIEVPLLQYRPGGQQIFSEIIYKVMKDIESGGNRP